MNVRSFAACVFATLAFAGAANAEKGRERLPAQRFTHDRMIGSPGRDPFSYKDSMMVMFVPASRSAPQIAVGIKCFEDGYSILTLGMPGYEKFSKDPDGYAVSFKVNAGAIVPVHMFDTPRNTGVVADSHEEPRVRELLGRFLDADTIAISFRGEAYMLTTPQPDRDARKMMNFCGPKE